MTHSTQHRTLQRIVAPAVVTLSCVNLLGCLHASERVTVQAVNDQTSAPIANVDLRTSYGEAGFVIDRRPSQSRAITRSDGRATITLVRHFEAGGFLNASVRGFASRSIPLESLARHNVEFRLQPLPRIVLELPDHFRGLFAVRRGDVESVSPGAEIVTSIDPNQITPIRLAVADWADARPDTLQHLPVVVRARYKSQGRVPVSDIVPVASPSGTGWRGDVEPLADPTTRTDGIYLILAGLHGKRGDADTIYYLAVGTEDELRVLKQQVPTFPD